MGQICGLITSDDAANSSVVCDGSLQAIIHLKLPSSTRLIYYATISTTESSKSKRTVRSLVASASIILRVVSAPMRKLIGIHRIHIRFQRKCKVNQNRNKWITKKIKFRSLKILVSIRAVTHGVFCSDANAMQMQCKRDAVIVYLYTHARL